MKLSIIVPVYNVEKYVERCILSIVSQGISEKDYELICVNDGSTDHSSDILLNLRSKYPFIQLIYQNNSGLSAARNKGLEYATGDYIFFIDSDDWIADNSLSFLLELIDKNRVDILLFGCCQIDDKGKQKWLISNLSTSDKPMLVKDYMVDNTIRSAAWAGIFSRHLFVENNLLMKKGFYAEDDDFVVRIFSVANNVMSVKRLVYFYYQREDSISNNKLNKEKIVYDKLQIVEDLKGYIAPFDGKLRVGLERKMDFLSMDILRLLIRQRHSSETIDKVLPRLRDIGYYPLRKANYSNKYSCFRIILNNPFLIRFITKKCWGCKLF